MFSWMDDELATRRQGDLYRERRPVDAAQGVRLRLAGRELINFASNDYLNLAADPRLARAAALAARRYGTGARASALVSGWSPSLRRLERALAFWEGADAALVFSSGYTANLSLLSALGGRGDAMFSDERNHASLIDGCRLGRADVHVYRHADLNHLADLLRQHGPSARRRFIVTDSVFSMDGDVASVDQLVALAREHAAVVIVDEAHATGILGDHGCGVAQLQSQDPERLVKVGTLSKALGSQGGFVVGSRRLIDWLVNSARPYIYSTALAPPVAAAAHRAVLIAQTEPWRRQVALTLAEHLRQALRDLHFEVGTSCCQIVPLIVGDAEQALSLSQRLQEDGYLVPAIRPPSVGEGGSRLRISLTAGHTQADVDQLIGSLRKNR
jgi:8-amino-7-oxononanoate synthase